MAITPGTSPASVARLRHSACAGSKKQSASGPTCSERARSLSNVRNRARSATAPGSGDFLKGILDKYAPMSPKTIWLRHVADVQATNDARVFKAPGLRIVTDTDEVLNLSVVATPTTWSGSSENNSARDGAVQLLRSACEAAKSAGGP